MRYQSNPKQYYILHNGKLKQIGTAYTLARAKERAKEYAKEKKDIVYILKYLGRVDNR
jgi:hypothetical protein